jgi:hypothetical protein
VPTFDSKELQEKYSRLQSSAQEFALIRLAISRFRDLLETNDLYEGSKLQLMDDYKVKLTELSEFPFFLKLLPPARPRKKGVRRKELVSKKKAKLNTEEGDSGADAAGAVVEKTVSQSRLSGRVRKATKHNEDEGYNY